MENLAYLGVAVKHPIALVSGRGVLTAGQQLIDQSIQEILSTPQGTRLFLPEYGSRLEELLFETNDEVLAGMIRLFVSEAIAVWERRIRFVDADLTIEESLVLINITYEILASNQIRSYIYPFYRKIEN